jgi:uncharacterized protein (TIGR03437 family)
MRMRNPIGGIVVAALLMLPVSTLAQGVRFTNSPSPGTVGISYSFQFTASGALSYTYSCQCTNPAPGLTLSSSGAITGTPSMAGTFMFNAEVADAHNSENNSGFVTMSIQIGAQPLTINTTSVNDATRGVLYSNPLMASGGTGGYSWSLSGGALPGGLSVNSGGSIGGTPLLSDVAGVFNFTVEAMDNSSNVAFQRLTMTLHNPALTLSPSSLLPGILNGVYSSGVTASGGAGPPTPYTYSWSGTTPPGLMLNTATGAITGTPTAMGTYNFTIGVSDGSTFTPTFTPQPYSITIYPVITIAPSSIPAADAGSNYSQTFTASGGSGSSYTYSIVGTPAGMSFNTSTGVLSGLPSSGGPFTITAHDGAGFSGSQNYTLVVNPALTLAPASLNAGQVGTVYSQNFTAGGGSGTGYSYTFTGTSVPGLNFIGNNLGGTPTKGGTYMFSITAKDSLGYPITNNYSLSIANPPIQVMPGSIPSGQVGVSYGPQGFTASGGNGGPYTFSANTPNPFGLTFNPSTATLSGTPTSFGTMTFTVTANDGTLQGHTDYTLTIAPAPLTLSPSSIPNGVVGTAYSQQFTASGGLGNYTFSIIGTQPPGLGLTSGGANATLGGNPTTAGSYPFSVQVSDGSHTASQSFTMTINNPPITLGPATLPPGIVNGNYSQTFVASGGNGGPYTYSINGATPGLTLNTTTGVLSGAPTSATTYNFTIGVSDGSQFTPAFTPKAYSIVVEPAITIAPSTIPAADPNVNYSQTFTASGGSGSGYSYAISALPAGMSFNASTGVLSGPPSATSSFTITAKDSAGLTGSQNYTLTVNAALTLSPPTLSPTQTGAQYSQSFTASGGSGVYTYSFTGTQPPGLNFNAGAATLTGTPTVAGSYPFSVTAKDSLGGQVTVNYTLAVNNPPITLGPASLLPGIVNGNYSATFIASGGNGGPYTYSINGSTPGLTLNTSTGVLSGAPTSATTYNFTIGVTDGSQFTPAFTPKGYSITVFGPITIAPTAIPNADPNVNYSQTFTASGGSGSGYSYSISALPAGMSFNASTGTLSGPPSASGPFPFTITAKDSAGFSATSGTITLTVNAALTLSPTTLSSAQVGTGFSQAFTATGGSGGYSYSLVGTPPPGLGLSSNVLSGTPTTSGTFPFSISEHDSLGGSVTNAYTLTVANPPIVVQPTTISSGQIGVSYSQVFTASGGNGGPYTYSISGGSLFGLGFNAGTATLSGTPASAGTSNITVSASDGTLNGQRSYTLTVNPSGLTLSPTSIGGGTVGVKYSQGFSATGGSGNYTFTLSPPNPSGLTFSSNGATATLSGTPTTFGSFPLTLQLNDGTSTVSRNYTLSISSQALSISTTNLPAGQAGVSYSASLSANGGTPPYTWSVTSSALPGGLFLTAGNGAITGTPNGAGSFSFGVTVTDSAGLTANATLSISVQPGALMFTTTSPLPPALSGVSYSAGLGATGGTPPYTFALTAGPQGLGISGSTLSGKLTNTGSTPLTYNLTIKLSDNAGASVGAGFQLTVQPAAAGIILSAGSLAFTAVSQGPPQLPQYVSVNSTTQASVAFTASTDQPWLSVGPGSGNTPATLQVSVNQAGLQPGMYTGNVTVTGLDGPHNVSVTLQVNAAPPQLSVVPTIVSFVTDGVVQPGAGSIQVSNAGDGSLTFSASLVNGSSWVSLGSFSTTVTGGSPVSIPVNAVIAGLMVGDYRDVVHIDSTAGTADVPVTLLVAGGSTISLVPSASLFSSRQGQGLSNGTRSFQIVTTGNMPVDWTATLLGGSGWLTLNTPNGTSSSNTAGVVSYTVDPSNLGMGSFYARIHIDAPTATNGPVDFVVVSSVDAASTPADPDPTPAGALFVSSPGSAAPPAQIITINTSSITPIAFTAAANTYTGGNWLSVAPTTGMTSTASPAQVTATINASGMATGVYQGGVSFTLQGNPTGVRTVSIVLIVTGSAQSPTLVSRLDRLEPRATCNPAKLVAVQTGLVSNFSTPAGWPIPLAIQLADDCGNAVSNGSVVASFSNGDAPLALQLSDNKHAVYSATWNPHGAATQVTVSANATAPSLQGATAQIIGTVSPNSVPILYKHGTIHNLNPLPGSPLAPGTIVQIYGSGLAPSVLQTALPLPTNVNGTIAIIGGISAPLYYVSDGQLDAQLPLELSAGRQYQILISANGALTTPDTIDIEPVTPGVAAALDGSIIAQHVDTSYVTPAAPAHPGEILTIYLAGMGLTDVPVMTGAQSPSDPLAHPMVQPTVMVNGEQAAVGFAGLTPQLVGLYQINFTVPADAPLGNLKLEVLQGTAQSNVSTLPVSQ